MPIEYQEEPELTAHDFLALARRIWPRHYDSDKTTAALRRTINITARFNGQLIGAVRVLTDGYFFGTIPEILVDPSHQRHGIGSRLMQLAWERSPTSLFFGAQPGNEPFFEKLGFSQSM